jgi:hypothetical protein
MLSVEELKYGMRSELTGIARKHQLHLSKTMWTISEADWLEWNVSRMSGLNWLLQFQIFLTRQVIQFKPCAGKKNSTACHLAFAMGLE